MLPPSEDKMRLTAIKDKFCHAKLSRWMTIILVLVCTFLFAFLMYQYSFSPESHGARLEQSTAVLHSNITFLQGPDPDANDTAHIRYKHTNRQLPGCIIIGSRKAGTRALLNYLNLHPNIMTAKTEVHYFDNDENYEQGLEWYRKKMPYSFPGQITVEKTPGYFVSRDAPQRVHQMNSTIKLLLIVRDPSERAVSDYLQIYLNQVEKYGRGQSFESLALDESGEVDVTYQAIKRSLYYRYMMRWMEYFNLAQFHIVNGEKLVEDPYPEMKKVETFLGLQHRLRPDMFYYNETRHFFCIRNDDFQKCLNPSKGRQHPDLPPQVVSKLREFYAPHNRNFYFLVKQDFDWPEH